MRWMSIHTYIALITGIHKTNARFNFDSGNAWHNMVKSNDIALKAATIVMFDRWSDKNDKGRV
ncbi:hypothetical protein D3C80_849430 [compost metagenome]